MPVIDYLASTLARRDEAPNIALAERLTAQNDAAAIAELCTLLRHKSKDIQSDAVKVLYEIGERKPGLIAPHAGVFLDLLESKNNRLVWGAMTALDTIAAVAPGAVHAQLPAILKAAGRGSVIAKDHAVGILIKLAGAPQYADDVQTLLLDMMRDCATNQLPMYAENARPVISGAFKAAFAGLLAERLDEIEKESKRKRVEKVLKRLK